MLTQPRADASGGIEAAPGIDPAAIADLVGEVFRPERCTIRRMREGVSTYVFRVSRRTETFYVRVLPAAGQSFEPEVRVHAQLVRRGASVPRVLHFEACRTQLGRSVMITTAVPGRSVERCPSHLTPAVLRSAGRDLALVNTLPVEGFGWIRRDEPDGGMFRGRWPDRRGFLADGARSGTTVLRGSGLSPAETATVEQIVERYRDGCVAPCGSLAHGDFRGRHIFAQAGRYTGIIDFSAIQGADPLYDLAWFAMFGNCAACPAALTHLLAGYEEIVPLPADRIERIAFHTVLIAVGALARHARNGADVRTHAAYHHLTQAMSLLGNRPARP